MSNELQTRAPTGSTVYSIVRSPSAQPWNTVTLAFEDFNPSNYANYAVPTTEEDASGFFTGSMPSAITISGTFSIEFFIQAGSSPSKAADTFNTGGPFRWNGAVEVPYIPVPTTHYGTSDLILEIYGIDLYNYVFDLTGNNNPDPARVEWASLRGDEKINMKLFPSVYAIPLISTGGPLSFVPNWWGVYSFSAAYQVRGRQVDNDAAEGRYTTELRRVNSEIRSVVRGATTLNAVLRVGGTNTPLALPMGN